MLRAVEVTFSPDGRLLALRTNRKEPEDWWGDGLVSVFEVGEGGVLVGERELVSNDPDAMAFSPDGKLLVAAYRDSSGAMVASLFSVGPDGAVSEVDGPPFKTGGDYPGIIVFSPDGRLLATANVSSGDSAAVRVFSIGEDAQLTEVAGSPIANGAPYEETLAPAFSPDGRLLAITAPQRGTVSVFAVGPDGALTAISGSPFAAGTKLGSPAFSPDGTLLAVRGSGGPTGSVFVLFAVGSSGALTPVAGSPLNANAGAEWVRFSPNGKLLAVAGWHSDRIVAGWDTDRMWMSLFGTGPGGAVSPVPGSPFDISGIPEFSPDGRRLAVKTGPEGVAVMAIGADQALSPLPGSPFPGGSGRHSRPLSLAFSPDGNLLAVADNAANSVSVLAAAPTA
jgi:WD40 repeat protein